MKRKVWSIKKAGAIKQLKLIDESLEILEVGKLRIQVRAVGLNFADIFALSGLYSATPQGEFIPGLEFSGQVIEVNDQNSDFKVGDKVMGVTRFGGYATVIDSSVDYLSALPKDWSYQQGAAYLTQTLTAYYSLVELGNLKQGQTVLVQSAAGGVGLQAMKLIKALGANPIGTVSSQHKKAFLNKLGFDHILIRENNFSQQLDNDNLKFDLVLDAIGGKVQKACFDHLNPMGRLIVFGAAEFTPGENRPNYLQAAFKYLTRPKYDVMDMISDNKSVMAFNLIWLWQQVNFLKTLISDMQSLDIPAPHVGHEFDFENALDAIEFLRQGNNIGKVVLNVGEL